MTVQLYNTLTRAKTPFVPLHAARVGIYVCGVTVWDSTHLGHGRAATVFDMLVRLLRHRGYAVTYVRNYTDVDDKIINRANAEGVSWDTIAKKYIAEYAADMAALGNVPPDIEPLASAHITHMIALIERLIARGLAYAVDGDVFYAVRKFPGYGKLSGKKIEELEVGARIEANEAKRDPLDFALWKAAKSGEPSWDSPWGAGRPGWHIECSAMSSEYLGQPFDIHGGGRDLIFPHHENEIAQSEGASGCDFVRCWMHNGSLTIDSEKMSKSLGNYFKTSEALQRFDHEVLRYFLLSSHYRSPLDFSPAAVVDCGRALERFYETTARLGEAAGVAPAMPASDLPVVQKLAALPDEMNAALDDDLNTPRAFGALFEAVRELNRYLDTQPDPESPVRRWAQAQWSACRTLGDRVFGVFGSAPADFCARCEAKHCATEGVDRAAVERLVADRTAARTARDFARADDLRDQLAAMGVEIKDGPGGTEWKLKS